VVEVPPIADTGTVRPFKVARLATGMGRSRVPVKDCANVSDVVFRRALAALQRRHAEPPGGQAENSNSRRPGGLSRVVKEVRAAASKKRADETVEGIGGPWAKKSIRLRYHILDGR